MYVSVCVRVCVSFGGGCVCVCVCSSLIIMTGVKTSMLVETNRKFYEGMCVYVCVFRFSGPAATFSPLKISQQQPLRRLVSLSMLGKEKLMKNTSGVLSRYELIWHRCRIQGSKVHDAPLWTFFMFLLPDKLNLILALTDIPTVLMNSFAKMVIIILKKT